MGNTHQSTRLQNAKLANQAMRQLKWVSARVSSVLKETAAYSLSFLSLFQEILNGVGVDGVGGICPFFLFFLRFLCFFFFFSPTLLGQEQRLQLTGRTRDFTPTPSAPTPFRTSRLFVP